MKRFEAKSLEETYQLATKEFGCSMNDLTIKVVQYPSSGVLGLFGNGAVIEAEPKNSNSSQEKIIDKHPKNKNPMIEQEPEVTEAIELEKDKIVDDFHSSRDDERILSPESDAKIEEEILARIEELMSHSCYDVDVIEVDIIDECVCIFVDGENMALLIGKNGYRYNALYYVLSSWIQSKYQLCTKLEVASFITDQSAKMPAMIETMVVHEREHEWARTKPLDGVLLSMALEMLRERFPDRYVAIKRRKDGKRYVLVSQFNKK